MTPLQFIFKTLIFEARSLSLKVIAYPWYRWIQNFIINKLNEKKLKNLKAVSSQRPKTFLKSNDL